MNAAGVDIDIDNADSRSATGLNKQKSNTKSITNVFSRPRSRHHGRSGSNLRMAEIKAIFDSTK